MKINLDRLDVSDGELKTAHDIHNQFRFMCVCVCLERLILIKNGITSK